MASHWKWAWAWNKREKVDMTWTTEVVPKNFFAADLQAVLMPLFV